MNDPRVKATVIWDSANHQFVVTTPPCEGWSEYPFKLNVEAAVSLIITMLKTWPGLAFALAEEGVPHYLDATNRGVPPGTGTAKPSRSVAHSRSKLLEKSLSLCQQ